MPEFLNFGWTGVIPVLLIVVVLVLVVAYMGSRYKVAGANEALIISGRREKGPEGQVGLKVVRGQGVIVLPLIHKVGKLHLSARQINVQLSDAVTKQGIKVAVQGVATVKIGSDEESIRSAAERFLDREDQIDSIVKNVLEGSLRSIVGTLTVEELNYDRAKFQQEVQSAARSDLATSGLGIDNFTIQAIRDEVGYMDLIGQQETARRERDARMAKALADQEAAVREAEAQQIKLNAQRDVSLRQAEVEALTQSADAKAAQAGPLAQAEATQEVVRRQTELAQLEADRKQKELIASTIRPAEAEADALVKRAEGDKLARIAQAQAEAERVRLAGQAEANIQVMKGEAAARVTEVNAEATAKQTTLEGNAEAGIVLSKGEAEAKALALRADAYRQFNEAAVIQTVLSMLPEIVRAAAEPMGRIDQLTVLSNDGASELVRNTTRTVTEASATVKGLTGIDVPSLIGTAMGSRFGNGAASHGTDEGGSGGSGGSGGADKSGGAGKSRGSRGTGGNGGGSPRPTSARARREPPAAPTASSAPTTDADEQLDRSETLRAAASVVDRAAEQARGGIDRAREGIDRAREGVDRAIGQPTPAPSVGTSAPARSDAADLRRESTLSQAAEALADDLLRIPGIQRFGDMRLADLESSGPRPLRTMWRVARDRVEREYGEMTIGEIIDRYQGGDGGVSAGA